MTATVLAVVAMVVPGCVAGMAVDRRRRTRLRDRSGPAYDRDVRERHGDDGHPRPA
ncbi:hypothetical protein [Streptomyces sp. NPDC002463]|uniref:hypothetical protein n=1 Tax=Streptomyces sp. NPDC002463 TaxID=3364645 RepID=UPI003693A921